MVNQIKILDFGLRILDLRNSIYLLFGQDQLDLQDSFNKTKKDPVNPVILSKS